MVKLIVASLFVVAAGQEALWKADLKRARQWTPRSEYRGHGTLASANARLNIHLAKKQGIRLRACEDFTTESLRDTLRNLFPFTSAKLKAIYSKVDGRGAKYQDIASMEAHWAESAPAHDMRVHDAHCHEIVMWFVHHISSDTQATVMKNMVLPKLPVADHTFGKGSRAPNDAAGQFYDEKVTCQNCHVGGISNLGLPEVAPKTKKEKQRRCYTNYKELFGIECGPCDGIAGPYSGDDDKYFTPTACEVVGTPEQIPEGERVKNALPPQFSVDVVGGSDRFGRTTNPTHDQLPEPIARIYGQISGKWFMDAKPGADLWLLRHDTTYASVTENGVPIPFIAPRVSEIHAQTAKQRSQNCTGQMVSLIHGMPSFIPGGCTCMPDPVGVPDITASSAAGLDNMQYMGRIRLPELEYLKVPIELDHWANWFFHIFMDTNKSVPHYGKAPSRLASAYAGTAVYANWKMEDPKISDPTVWHREIPTSPMRVGPDHGKYCMDTKKSPICSNITASNFPPTGQPADSTPTNVGCGTEAKNLEQNAKLPFFPHAKELLDAIARVKAEVTPELEQMLV